MGEDEDDDGDDHGLEEILCVQNRPGKISPKWSLNKFCCYLGGPVERLISCIRACVGC